METLRLALALRIKLRNKSAAAVACFEVSRSLVGQNRVGAEGPVRKSLGYWPIWYDRPNFLLTTKVARLTMVSVFSSEAREPQPSKAKVGFLNFIHASLLMPLILVLGPSPALASKPAPKPYYIYAEKGVYYYEAALTRQQREAGYIANEAVGYRYFGKNADGEYAIATVDRFGRISEYFYCKKPCRVVRSSTGERLVLNSRMLLWSVFNDVFRGLLKNTAPDPQFAKLFRAWKTLDEKKGLTVAIPSGTPGKTSIEASSFNGGVVISAPENTEIFVTADGRVSSVTGTPDLGKTVTVDHGNGINSIYGSIGKVDVSPETTIKRGQRIGSSSGTQLNGQVGFFYSITVDGKPVDPRPFMRAGIPKN
jgi:Peptidase family M23